MKPSDAWKSFHDEPLSDGQSWSATWDSYDQYRDIVYYRVDVQGVVVSFPPFMIAIDLAWAASITDWNSPTFIETLRAQLAEHATIGKTNTTHTRDAPLEVPALPVKPPAPEPPPTFVLADVPPDYAMWRATFSSVSAAIDACERVDWLVLIGYEMLKPKAAIEIARKAAAYSHDTEWGELLWQFNPLPNRIETVEEWLGDRRDLDGSKKVRTLVFAMIPGSLIAALIITLVMPGVWTLTKELVYSVLIIACSTACFPLVRRALASVIRRRAARLDEHGALQLALGVIRKASARKPKRVPGTVKLIARELREQLAAS